MKSLNRLYLECVSEARSIGLDISERIVSVEVNGRLSRALGRCCARYAVGGGYTYRIEINPCMLADGLDDHIPKNTIMHELIHTCADCFNHGPEFQYRAGIVNRKLGYNVHTMSDAEQLKAAGVVLKETAYNYGIVCNECGRMLKKYKRWSSTLENINGYRHGGTCGGSLHVVSLGKMDVLSVANKTK